MPAGLAPEVPDPALCPAVEHTPTARASTGNTVARKAVPVRSAAADHTLPASIVHPSLVPALALHTVALHTFSATLMQQMSIWCSYRNTVTSAELGRVTQPLKFGHEHSLEGHYK